MEKERFADRIYGYSRFCGGEPEKDWLKEAIM